MNISKIQHGMATVHVNAADCVLLAKALDTADGSLFIRAGDEAMGMALCAMRSTFEALAVATAAQYSMPVGDAERITLETLKDGTWCDDPAGGDDEQNAAPI